MTTLAFLPAPVRPPPRPRFQFVQMVLTPDNRVAMFIGQKLTPHGLMAFIADAATPAGKRRSQMVPYECLRPAPLGKPRLAVGGSNARNPFADLDAVQAEPVAARMRLEPPPVVLRPKEPMPVVANKADVAPIPAFLRRTWARDRDGRKLAPYPPRLALLALAAFRLWPSLAARRFDAARLIEAVRTGALICGPRDQSILARAAAGAWGGP